IRSGRADFITAEQAGQRMTAAGLSAAPARMVSFGRVGPRRVGRADTAESGARRAKAEAQQGHLSRCPDGTGRALFRTAAQDGQTIRSADMMQNLCAVSAPRQSLLLRAGRNAPSFQRIGRSEFSPRMFREKSAAKASRFVLFRPGRDETNGAAGQA